MLSGVRDIDLKIVRYLFPNQWGQKRSRRLNMIMILFRVDFPIFAAICKEEACYGIAENLTMREIANAENRSRQYSQQNILEEVKRKASFWRKYVKAFSDANLGDEIIVTDKVRGKTRAVLYRYALAFGCCYIGVNPKQVEVAWERNGRPGTLTCRYEEYKMEKSGLLTKAQIKMRGWQELPEEIARRQKVDEKYGNESLPRWIDSGEDDKKRRVLYKYSGNGYKCGRVKTTYECIKFIKCCN